MAEAFLYMWVNIVTGKRYIGVHKGTPDDGYVTSCKTLLEDYDTAPYLFTRLILNTGSYERMLELETSMLRFSDAKNNPDFYNMHNGDGKFYLKGHTTDTKRKQSEIMKHKISLLSDDERKHKYGSRNIGRKGVGAWKGKKNPAHSQRMKGNKNPLGVVRSESTKAKLRASALRQWERIRNNSNG